MVCHHGHHERESLASLSEEQLRDLNTFTNSNTSIMRSRAAPALSRWPCDARP